MGLQIEALGDPTTNKIGQQVYRYTGMVVKPLVSQLGRHPAFSCPEEPGRRFLSSPRKLLTNSTQRYGLPLHGPLAHMYRLAQEKSNDKNRGAAQG